MANAHKHHVGSKKAAGKSSEAMPYYNLSNLETFQQLAFEKHNPKHLKATSTLYHSIKAARPQSRAGQKKGAHILTDVEPSLASSDKVNNFFSFITTSMSCLFHRKQTKTPVLTKDSILNSTTQIPIFLTTKCSKVTIIEELDQRKA